VRQSAAERDRARQSTAELRSCYCCYCSCYCCYCTCYAAERGRARQSAAERDRARQSAAERARARQSTAELLLLLQVLLLLGAAPARPSIVGPTRASLEPLPRGVPTCSAFNCGPHLNLYPGECPTVATAVVSGATAVATVATAVVSGATAEGKGAVEVEGRGQRGEGAEPNYTPRASPAPPVPPVPPVPHIPP
jgi:hypothetical protein